MPTSDGGWMYCPDCTASRAAAAPTGPQGMLVGLVVAAMVVLGLLFGAVKVFGIDTNAHPDAPKLDPLYARATTWRGTLSCPDGDHRVRMILLVGGDRGEKSKVVAALTLDPGRKKEVGMGISGTIDESSNLVLDTPTRKSSSWTARYLRSFRATVTSDPVLRLRGPVSATRCTRLALRKVKD